MWINAVGGFLRGCTPFFYLHRKLLFFTEMEIWEICDGMLNIVINHRRFTLGSEQRQIIRRPLHHPVVELVRTSDRAHNNSISNPWVTSLWTSPLAHLQHFLQVNTSQLHEESRAPLRHADVMSIFKRWRMLISSRWSHTNLSFFLFFSVKL